MNEFASVCAIAEVRSKNEETYAWLLVSGSVRSELHETCDFGWTTAVMKHVVALIKQLLRVKK